MTEAEACLVLGVPRGADAEVVKSAFNAIALRCHPDHAPDDPGAGARFARAREAQKLLMGLAGKRGPVVKLRRDGADVAVEVRATLEQAAGLAPVVIVASVGSRCSACGATGSRSSHPVTCEACAGSGVAKRSHGLIRTRMPCDACAGEGVVRHVPCSECNGTGGIPATSSLRMTLPPGIADGEVLRLTGRGQPGLGGGRAGDLVATVKLLAHGLLRRRGDDLLSEVRVSFADLCLGGRASAVGLDGAEVEFQVPRGSASGSVVIVPGHGMPQWEADGRGRLLVRIEADVPSAPTPRQEELARLWRQAEAEVAGNASPG